MGSMQAALKELNKDLAKAARVNEQLGLKPGGRVRVYGQVYLQPGHMTGNGQWATLLDIAYPKTARVKFQDGTTGFADKYSLRVCKCGMQKCEIHG
jgi:hypothetical protein